MQQTSSLSDSAFYGKEGESMKQKVLTMIGFVFCIVTLLPGIAFANDNTTEATEFNPLRALQILPTPKKNLSLLIQ